MIAAALIAAEDEGTLGFCQLWSERNGEALLSTLFCMLVRHQQTLCLQGCQVLLFFYNIVWIVLFLNITE